MFSHDLLEVILNFFQNFYIGPDFLTLMFSPQIFTNVLIAYGYILQLYPFIRAWEGVLRAPAHEFAQHMHMKVETHAHAHTQVEKTPEARM